MDIQIRFVDDEIHKDIFLCHKTSGFPEDTPLIEVKWSADQADQA